MGFLVRGLFKPCVILLIVISFVAEAAPKFPDVKMSGHAEPYFASCDVLVDALNSETPLEDYLTQMATTEGQRLQLLADYGLFFTHEWQMAMRLILEEEGIHLTEAEMKTAKNNDGKEYTYVANLKPLKRYTSTMAELLSKMDDKTTDAFVARVLEKLQELVVAKEDEAEAQVLNLQLKNLFTAISRSEHKAEYDIVLRTMTRNMIAANVAQLAKKVAHQQEQNAMGPVLIPTFLTVVGSFGASLVLWASGDLTNNNWLNFGITVAAPVVSLFTPIFAFDFIHKRMKFSKIRSGAWPATAAIQVDVGHSLALEQHLEAEREKAEQARAEKEKEDAGGTAEDEAETNVTENEEDRETWSEEARRVELSHGLLTKEYLRSVSDILISVEQACEVENICQLSPVQVAYIGHYDLLRVKVLAKSMGETLNTLGVQGQLGDLETAALELRQKPDSYKKQVALIRELTTYVKNFEKGKETAEEVVGLLKESIEKAQAHLKKLKALPYNFNMDNYTEELIEKNELLLARMNADLEALNQMQVDQDQLLRSINASHPLLSELSKLLENAKSGEDMDWQKMADDTRLLVDRMKLGGE